jgi:RNase3 domain protein
MEAKYAIQLNPLSLAFLGDAAFTLYVRERLINEHDGKSGYLHGLASRLVCAAAQAKMLDALSPSFTDEESEIARRSRNSHNTSKAKNAGLSDYKKATALEGVFGFLRITGRIERLEELMKRGVDIIETGGNG